ncbi:wax ester/triacylglycerol synthase family O-acyltransferase [Litorivivens sp.]|uniref:WS/DGAT/MGAT family O-acyltransferase n=1 Tax=Litorivivens sp. TaxID=2020868 RepID=UPI003568E15E
MKQLGIIDSAFVNLEHPHTPQHIGGLGIYDQSTAPGGSVRFKGVIANFEQRLLKQPIFRARLVHTPGGFDRPYWVQDANFDVEFHIRHIALPKPGDWRQLCILVSRLHARPLDMSRPLWEVYIIEGLDNIVDVPEGAFAIYTKMHHSLVDGAGGASFMSAIHDLEPNPKLNTERTTITVDTPPTPGYLAAAATVNQVKNTFKMAKGAAGLAKDIGKFALGLARKEIPMPPISAPKTRFNKPVGPYRAFDAAEFSLEEIKAVKNAADCKVNDVVLAIVSGAMRRYLDNLGELPEKSLAVSVPLNMRTRRGVTEDNNQIGSVFLELHTHIKDPLERLRAIMKSSSDAKSHGESSPLVDALKVTGMFSPALTKPFINMYINNQLTRHVPANISGVVSNVAGPPFPLYTAGAKMVRYYGMGLLTPGMGIFNLAFTSNGLLTLSLLADRDTVSDPSTFVGFMYETFEELKEAALNRRSDEEAAEQVKDNVAPLVKKPRVAASAAKKAKATAPAPKAPPRKAKAVKTSASKRKQASKKQLEAVSSVAAEVKQAENTAKPAPASKAKPPAKAPVRKAAKTNGKGSSESVTSIFADVDAEPARKESALH